MAASYKKLWTLLIDRDMKKKDLRELTNVHFLSCEQSEALIYQIL